MEPGSRAVAIPVESARTRLVFSGALAGMLQPVVIVTGRVGEWASETAQQFGAVVSALMGPAVLCAYAIAVWSLTANLGFTDNFLFTSGALSNWLIWLALAILVHLAASILRRRIEE